MGSASVFIRSVPEFCRSCIRSPGCDEQYVQVLEVGILLSEVLNVRESLGSLCYEDLDENCNHLATQSLLLENRTLDSSSRNASDLGLNTSPSTEDAPEELSCGTVNHDNCIAESVAHAYSDLKPVSALKGSREKQGIIPSTKLSVKWSPEVYDPPITSSSHTVKGHQRHHRHNSKKGQYLSKYTKGKSSRGSNSEKKHAHRRSSRSTSSSVDPQTMRLQHSAGSDIHYMNNYDQPKINSPDSAVTKSAESNIFASSCHMNSLSPVSHTVEAS